MNFKQLFLITVTFVTVQVAAGQDIAGYLKQVRENNPEITAFRKLLEAKKYEARTGLTPPDPSISFGYMPGATQEIGTKKTWSVTQSFAFPTKYILKNRISKSTLALAEQEFNLGMLNTLLEAKFLLFAYIYNQKTLELLRGRKELYDGLRSGWGKLLESGGATVLEYNKILLEFSSLNLRISRIESEITILKEKLHYMSGTFDLPDAADYPPVVEIEKETLITEKSSIHPAFLLPESEYQISLQEVKLSRTGSLPEFQAGVASEIIPGEKYTGPVAGLSVPLWANSNRVKTAVAMAEHSAAARDATLLGLKASVRSEYENMTAIKKSMMEIEAIIESANNKQFLDKALEAGEISLNDYFIYLGGSFQAEDRFYELEYEYNKSLALLHDHDLIK
ncbi:MAG: TolC family protein [Bacteroidales bacterium]